MNMLTSSVGKKIMMAVTGVILVLFIIGHVIGNMTIFVGPDGINAYAVHLRDLGPLLWLVRLVMLSIFLFHVYLGVSLTLENKAARPVGYNQKTDLVTGFAAQTMWVSGLVLLAFVVYHVLHFTLHVGVDNVGGLIDAAGRFDVYTMVVQGFHKAINTIFYVVAMAFLFLHVSHGFQSFWQSLGLNNERTQPKFQIVGKLVSLVVAAGFVSIPVIAMLILKA
ncbi:MAG: succinate dehydrogenase/fumarate reductase cytochrome b subunit [Desulfuromonas sp.]|nr:MAG: succinate dehydrogenase/fumarate reductase cytochrome b subunit [Desulfuromonas sp.]